MEHQSGTGEGKGRADKGKGWNGQILVESALFGVTEEDPIRVRLCDQLPTSP